MPKTESERNPNIPLEDYIKSEIGSLLRQDQLVVPVDPDNDFSVEIAAKREFDLRVKAVVSIGKYDEETSNSIKGFYYKSVDIMDSNDSIMREEVTRIYVDYMVYAGDWQGASLFIDDESNFRSGESRESSAGYLAAKAFLVKLENETNEHTRAEMIDNLMDSHSNNFVFVISYLETLSDEYAKTLNLEGLMSLRGMIDHSINEQFNLEEQLHDPEQEMLKARFEFLNQTNELNCMNVRFKTCQTDSDKKEFIRSVEDVQTRWNFQLLFIEEMLQRGKRLRVKDLDEVVTMFLEDVIDVTETDEESEAKNLYGNVIFSDSGFEDEFLDGDFDSRDRLFQLVRLAKLLAPYNERYGLDIWQWFVEGGEPGDNSMVFEDRTVVGLMKMESDPVKKAKASVDLVKIASWSGDYERSVHYAEEAKTVLEDGLVSRMLADELKSVIDLELMVNFPKEMGGYDQVEIELSDMSYDKKFSYACELVLHEFKQRQHLSTSFVESKLNWLFEILYEEPVGLIGSAFVNLYINGGDALELEEKVDSIWFIEELEDDGESEGGKLSKEETQEINIGVIESEEESGEVDDKSKILASVFDDKIHFLEQAADIFIKRGEDDLIFGLINHPEISKEMRAKFLLTLSEKMKNTRNRRK